jgi:hypothetical protein
MDHHSPGDQPPGCNGAAPESNGDDEPIKKVWSTARGGKEKEVKIQHSVV